MHRLELKERLIAWVACAAQGVDRERHCACVVHEFRSCRVVPVLHVYEAQHEGAEAGAACGQCGTRLLREWQLLRDVGRHEHQRHAALEDELQRVWVVPHVRFGRRVHVPATDCAAHRDDAFDRSRTSG